MLRHRIILNFDAHADGQTPETILTAIIESVTAQCPPRRKRMNAEPLLDSEFLEKLERLAIHWQKSFPGLVGGHNISHFAGAGPGVSGPSPISIMATICAPSTGAPTCAWKSCF